MTRTLAACALGLLAVGCGGDDSLSRAEWTERANAICLETLRKIEALGAPATSEDYLRVTPKANEFGRASIVRLRELKPPHEIERDARAMIDGYEDLIGLQQQVYEGLRAQRQGKATGRPYWRAANTALELARSTDAVAKRIRARDCARDPWQVPAQA